jgi:hypothetical protein
MAQVQRQLVDSIRGVILVLERDGRPVAGMVTLHDVLRAQPGFAAQHGEP